MKTKKDRIRVTLDLPIKVKEELDLCAKEMKMSRTGVITVAMQAMKAWRAPAMEKALEGYLKRFMKDLMK